MTRQFTSADPLGFAAGDANTRRFVGNNPLSGTDPSGMVTAREYISMLARSTLIGGAVGLACGLAAGYAAGLRGADLVNYTAKSGAWGGALGLVFGALGAVLGPVTFKAGVSSLTVYAVGGGIPHQGNPNPGPANARDNADALSVPCFLALGWAVPGLPVPRVRVGGPAAGANAGAKAADPAAAPPGGPPAPKAVPQTPPTTPAPRTAPPAEGPPKGPPPAAPGNGAKGNGASNAPAIPPSVRQLQLKSVDEQAKFLAENVPGLTQDQAKLLLSEAQKRNSSVVIGGSRVRGNHRPDSDLDVGYGNMSSTQAKKVNDKVSNHGPLKLEETRIVPGYESEVIPKITTPEEFFQRSGVRGLRDPKAGQPYAPSGSITVTPQGEVIIIPAGATPP